MNRLYKNIFIAASMTLPLMIGGCGGSSSGGAPSATAPTLTSITGIVIDDKIDNAKVCLDANSNNTCDVGELMATSLNGGKYTINNVPAADLNKPLIAILGTNSELVATTGVTTLFGKNASFSAPGGQKDALGNQNITPLTTMIKRVQETTGASATAAQSILKQQLGLTGSTIDLFADYTAVVAGDSYATTVAKAKLLKVAQVSTQVIADNYTGITGSAATGTSSAQVYTVIVDQLLANLSTMSASIDQYTAAGTFTVASAAASVPLVTTNTVALTALLSNVTVQQQATGGLSLQALLTGLGDGFNLLWSWSWQPAVVAGTQTNINYQVYKLKVNALTGLNTTQDWYANGVWQANAYTGWQANTYTGWNSSGIASSNNSNNYQTLDVATGVIAFSPTNTSIASIVINANGTATVNNAIGPDRSSVSIRATNLTAQTISSAIRVPEHGDGWLIPLTNNPTFTSPYAQAWDMVETTLTDQYSIWSRSDPALCAQNGVAYVAGVTNCNVMPLLDSYGNSTWNAATGSWTPATTLADIIVVDPYALLTDPYAIMQIDPYARLGSGWTLLATSKTAATGTRRYYDSATWNGLNQTFKPIGVATWTRQTIGGHKMIIWNYPPAVVSLFNLQGSPQEFFIENASYVYNGGVTTAGNTMAFRAFNNAALQDIKTAIGLPSALGAP